MKPPFCSICHQTGRAGKLCCKVGWQLCRRQLIGGGMKIFNPGVRAEVEPAWLLALLSCSELSLDMLVDKPQQPCVITVGAGVNVLGESAFQFRG